MKKQISARGVSFIEILVVIAIFAILGVLVGRITLITLRGSNKSESLGKVRTNLDYSLAVMERQLRNAETASPCNNTAVTTINYTDIDGIPSSFSCVPVSEPCGVSRP